MKKVMMFILIIPFLTFAQSQTDTLQGVDTTGGVIIVSQDINDCVNKIHDNPAVVKLFLRNLAMDKERMKETYRQLVNDPEIRRLVEQIRNNLRAEEQIQDDIQY